MDLVKVREVELFCPKDSLRCELKDTEYGQEVITDEPFDRGGTNTAAAPLTHLNVALASCQTVHIKKVAQSMRFNHKDIYVKCSTKTDIIDGDTGFSNGVMQFVGASLEINIETDEPQQKLDKLIQLSIDRCPVARLFSDAGFDPVYVWNKI
tara:strand:+ start:4050 stop:4505 length:456 start_codon:yes stop_codon:yes gene_type:complete